MSGRRSTTAPKKSLSLARRRVEIVLNFCVGDHVLLDGKKYLVTDRGWGIAKLTELT